MMQFYQNPYAAMSPFLQHPFMRTQAMMPDIGRYPPRGGLQDAYSYPCNHQDALELMREAVAGETADRLLYDCLINMAPCEEDKDILKGMRDNGIDNLGILRQIYYELTGKMLASPQETSFDKPSSYCEGLKRAIRGAHDAVRKYGRILYALQDRRHINMLTGMIIDGISHGTLYNYLYSNCIS